MPDMLSILKGEAVELGVMLAPGTASVSEENQHYITSNQR
jgi:hypothetical protein